MDLAGKEFWGEFWRRQDGRRFAGLSYFHRRTSKLLTRYAQKGCQACEIGCGASMWMPVLAKCGVDVWGIDYSEAGIELARVNLDRAGVKAHLITADVRDNDALRPGAFDVIFSLGFIEHFDDPQTVLSGIARALRPGGAMITLVPNFSSGWGVLQRWVDDDLFRLHTVYTCGALDEVHSRAGLEPLAAARFFGGFGPLVVNYTRPLSRVPPRARTAFIGVMWTFQQLVAWTLSMFRVSDGRLWSSHIAGVYTRVSGGVGR
jgi:SAM-dependent methyltransferase